MALVRWRRLLARVPATRGGSGRRAQPLHRPRVGDTCSAPTSGSGPPPTSTSSTAGGGGVLQGGPGALLHAANDIRSRGRGPMELRGRKYKRDWMRANQAIYRVGGGVEVFRTEMRSSTSSTSATSGAAPTGKSTTR